MSNKLRALLGNRQLRNMLYQPAAPDLTERISMGRLLLVSLPQALGEDAADLMKPSAPNVRPTTISKRSATPSATP